MKILISSLLLFLFVSLAVSQPRDTTGMELEIGTVEIRERRFSYREEVTTGTRMTSVSEQVLEGGRSKSMSELLGENTLVYIKSMGQGALSTSSFRGTASSHTQVNWNGFNINPSMSGSFDFSGIPVFFTDQVVLYHGNSYLKNGTGALGGSVHMNNLPDRSDPVIGRVLAEAGSFGTYTVAASVRYGGEKTFFRTRVFHQRSDNDYRYLNKIYAKDPFYERRKNASYDQSGFMQEAYFRLSRYATLSSNLWYQNMGRNLPQQVNISDSSRDSQDLNNLKFYVGYEREKGRHTLTAKGGYFLDIMEYDRMYVDGSEGKGTFNRSQSAQAFIDYTVRFSDDLRLNGSVGHIYDFIDATAFSSGRIDRNRSTFQANAEWRPVPRLTVSGQAMVEINDNRLAPTYSVGLSWETARYLVIKANTAYNYSYPDLNDLHWQPGGNPHLNPEHGFSYDLSFVYRPKIGNLLYTRHEATAYLMEIDNWIMWMPSGTHTYWTPENVRKVRAAGIELSTEWSFLLVGDWNLTVGGNYGFTSSTSRSRRYDEDVAFKKQLPYIPKHKTNGRIEAEYRGLSLTYRMHFTSLRYTLGDNSQYTEGYLIHSAELGYEWKLPGWSSLRPVIRVDNLFDTYYESSKYQPMPLRSITGSLLYTF